jgi:catechol 2,3-dioxygenase-like lactoylglutathione lyase family enzyme
MFDHVTIRVAERSASERFSDTVLAALGVDETYRTAACSEWENFHHAGYYAAYVLDPDGNNVEVVNHHRKGATT